MLALPVSIRNLFFANLSFPLFDQLCVGIGLRSDGVIYRSKLLADDLSISNSRMPLFLPVHG